MALDLTKLTVIGQSPDCTLWSYTTPDAAATVDTANYFDGALQHLKVGDFILARVATGGSIAFGIFVVNANDGTHVDVADMNAFGGTDTD